MPDPVLVLPPVEDEELPAPEDPLELLEDEPDPLPPPPPPWPPPPLRFSRGLLICGIGIRSARAARIERDDVSGRAAPWTVAVMP